MRRTLKNNYSVLNAYMMKIKSKHLSFAIFLIIILWSCNSSESTESQTRQNEASVESIQYGQVEAKLEQMEVSLPEMTTPLANYVHAVRTGNLVFLAGKGPRDEDGNLIKGKVGIDLTVEEGYQAARLVAISQLAALKAEIGELDKVNRIVKVTGMVNSSSDFTNHPEVINGFSDFMVEVFGDKGKHARAAVGMGSLPRNMAVEIEMIVELNNNIRDQHNK